MPTDIVNKLCPYVLCCLCPFKKFCIPISVPKKRRIVKTQNEGIFPKMFMDTCKKTQIGEIYLKKIVKQL